ncbi:MAG: FlgD immunoglobulin-like domain containing protein, partial [Bacteroidota bacterium]|nr:FlgD immunoglobulin-like domain containing protein [Bacteroidota bacterium]
FVNGAYIGAPASYTFENITSNHTIRVLFALQAFVVNLRTYPDSLFFIADGIQYQSPQQFYWLYNSNHTISAIDSQIRVTDVRNIFSQWSDLGSRTHTVTIRNDSSFTAIYRSQYYLTMLADSGGSVTPASAWQDSGKIVSIRAFAPQGFKFLNWVGIGIGSYSDTLNPANIVVLSPIRQVAKFNRYIANVTIQSNPVGLSILVDDTLHTSPRTFRWMTGSIHTISTIDTQYAGTSTRNLWNSWSDGGTRTHNVVPLNDSTFIVNFTTQYILTMQTNPGGSVTPPSGWYNRGTTVGLTAIPENNYRFTSWSGTGNGSYSGSNNPASVTINNPITELANFTRNPIQITISTVPQGRSFIYNGQTYTATQTRSVDPGSQQSLGAPSPQPDVSPDKQFIWSSWSDGGAQSHTIMPSTDSIFIAYFKTQYAITGTPLPTIAGTISPSGRRFYTEGDTIQLLATPNKGYVFTGWSGAITSTNNPLAIIVDGSKLLTANFVEAVQVTVTTTPVGRRIIVDDSTYISPKILNWIRGSSHTITAISPQSDTVGIEYIWTSWSDTGTISHVVAPNTDTTFRAFFSTRYFLTMEASTGGTVIPSNNWHTKGDTVTIVGFADSTYIFSSWVGSGSGSYSGNSNPAIVIMNSPINQHAIFGRLLPPPDLTGIPNGASGISTNPIISWFRYPGGASYNAQVSTDSSFTDTSKFVFNSVAIADTFIQVPNLANLKKYFWRVNAKVGQDITKFSSVRSFTTLNANITVDSPIMNWATSFKYDTKWRSENLSGNVNIKLSIENGNTYLLLKQNQANTGLFSWRVPDTLIQNQSIVLKCKLRIESSSNDVVFSESGEFSIVYGRLPNTVRMSTTVPYPTAQFNSTDYRLVSVPGLVDSLKFSNIVTGTQKFDWRIFADNGNNENFLQELSTNSSLRTGEGYWFIKNNNLEFTGFDISIPKLDSTAFYSISLHPGWNIIANPFDKLITWQSILYSNNISFASQLHSYNGSYKQESTLEPFKGYYFFNLNNLTTLKIPYPFGWIGSNKTNEADILWKVQIIYETELNRDPENFVGIASSAKIGEDSLDSRKPPLFMDQSFLYFERKDWDNTFSRFSSDLRPSLGDGQVWNFDISNPKKSQGTIHFYGIAQIPKEYEVILVNETNTTPFNLRGQSSYGFNAVQKSTPFKLIIGTAKFVEDEISMMIPDVFELSQNFPNPFNSSTTISVKLPIDSELMIEIFNTLGQKVIVLTHGRYPKGVHTFSWNGTDSNDQIVPTGIYFYRMSAGKEILLTKKMILIK